MSFRVLLTGASNCIVPAALDENGNPVEIELRGENNASLNSPDQQQYQAASTNNERRNVDLLRSTRMKNGEIKNAVKTKSRSNAAGLDVVKFVKPTTGVIENLAADSNNELSSSELLTRHNADNHLKEVLEALGERSTSSAVSINVASARRKRSNRKKARRHYSHTVSVIASDNAGNKHPTIQLSADTMTQRSCDVDTSNVNDEMLMETVVAEADVATANDCDASDRRSDGDGEDEDTSVRHSAISLIVAEWGVDEIRHSNDNGAWCADVTAGRVDTMNFGCESHGRTSTSSHSQHRDTVSPLSTPSCSTRRRKMAPETRAWSTVAMGVHGNGYRTITHKTARQDAIIVAEKKVETCLDKELMMKSDDGQCSTLERRLIQSSLATTRLTVADRPAPQSGSRVIPTMFDANATRAFLYDGTLKIDEIC